MNNLLPAPNRSAIVHTKEIFFNCKFFEASILFTPDVRVKKYSPFNFSAG